MGRRAAVVRIGDLLQLLGVVVRSDLIDQLAQFAAEHVVEPMGGEVDSMIRDPALREVVGADLFGPLTGADLTSALSWPSPCS